jgi:hypothetical protein
MFATGAGTAGMASASTSATSSNSSGTKVPRYNHIAVIMDTARPYQSTIGDPYAPVINRLAGEYGLANRYYTVSDPDTANILALLTGTSFSVSDGIPYWDQQLHQTSLLDQFDAAHLTWKEYDQGLPYPGYLGDCYPMLCVETDTLYNQTQFNSVPDLANVASNPSEAAKMVPGTELASDARAGRLPNFSLINPDECTDMHGGPPWCEDSPNFFNQPNDNRLVAAADSYIGQVVDEIMSGPQWKHGNNAIVVTFTEGGTSAGCCDANPGTGQVVTVVVTNHPRHVVDPTPFNHYSLLSTIQHAFGLGCLENTCDTTHVVPMAELFGARADPAPGAVGRAALATAAVAPVSPVAAPATPPASAATHGSPWHRVPSPNIGPNDNDLGAISGRSPSDIWAVGSLLPTGNATIVQTLAEHYDGTNWSVVPTPNVGRQANSFYGVTALPDGTAWATGIYTQASGHTGQALTEHWNGHAWSIVPAANPGSAEDMLYSAAAVNDSEVWAVGTYSGPDGVFHPLIEQWDGHSWTAYPIAGRYGPPDAILTSVTASGREIWATGQLVGRQAPDRQVVLQLVGHSWHVVSTAPVRTPAGEVASAYPQAIAATPNGLWVAGNDRAGDTGFSSLVEGPRPGGSLGELTTPNPTVQDNYLYGIAPVDGGTAAWAVGYTIRPSTGNGSTLIEFGSARGGWKIVPSPNPAGTGGNSLLDAIQAFSANDIWAVGTYDGPGGMRTMILQYTGGPSTS